ncbi:hypothetical protein BDR04DRAFT_625506 [Suillus decipiens]|nr:hypothetical protein BDR04DRAFT_625506 [Suillus decipiens]
MSAVKLTRHRFGCLCIQTSSRRSCYEPKPVPSCEHVNNVTRGAREIPCIIAAFFGKVTLHCASTKQSNVQQVYGHRGGRRPYDHLVSE